MEEGTKEQAKFIDVHSIFWIPAACFDYFSAVHIFRHNLFIWLYILIALGLNLSLKDLIILMGEKLLLICVYLMESKKCSNTKISGVQALVKPKKYWDVSFLNSQLYHTNVALSCKRATVLDMHTVAMGLDEFCACYFLVALIFASSHKPTGGFVSVHKTIMARVGFIAHLLVCKAAEF